MRVHVTIQNVYGTALKQVLQIFNCEIALDSETADVIVVEDDLELERFYTSHQQFIMVKRSDPGDMPKNCSWLNENEPSSLKKILKSLSDTKQVPSVISEVPQIQMIKGFEISKVYSPENTDQALRILIIDDKDENLQHALDLLGDNHFITLANGYGKGYKLIEECHYDVVLCDCQMPFGSGENTAFSAFASLVGQTVPCGTYLMFPATKKGAKFAIVTDGNHHQDWTSAIFDRLRDPQIINGQPVLLINYLGKQWDKALEALLAV
jgi:phosphorylcholine metabolism protein LicD